MWKQVRWPLRLSVQQGVRVQQELLFDLARKEVYILIVLSRNNASRAVFEHSQLLDDVILDLSLEIASTRCIPFSQTSFCSITVEWWRSPSAATSTSKSYS